MANKTIIVLLSAMICLTVSCSKKAIPVQTVTIVKDSVRERIVTKLKDTTIFFNDSVFIQTKTPCPELKPISKKSNDGLNLTIGVDSKGNLIADCKADSLKARIQWLESELIREKIHTEYKEVPIPVEKKVRYIPKWVWILLAVNFGFILFKYKSFFISLIQKI